MKTWIVFKVRQHVQDNINDSLKQFDSLTEWETSLENPASWDVIEVSPTA